jgi:hypothetical protein
MITDPPEARLVRGESYHREPFRSARLIDT